MDRITARRATPAEPPTCWAIRVTMLAYGIFSWARPVNATEQVRLLPQQR
ncbi:MAG: hypothetical protein SYR96_21680 [Actinomycetota bacterium]|nr:hypothetical protein [Actinomycetota bacterium]